MTRLTSAAVAALLAAPAAARDPDLAHMDAIDAALNMPELSTFANTRTQAVFSKVGGPGPVTVFAPSDAAFAKLGPAAVRGLRADPALLTEVLLAHVVDGKRLTAADVKALDGKAVNGFEVSAKDGVRIGGARAVRADIRTSNGVIHVIDAVLLPAGK